MTITSKLLAITILTLSLATSVQAADEIEWKLNSNFTPQRIENKLLRRFAEEAGTRSGGKLKVTVFEGGALNLRDADVLRWLPTGAAEIGLISASFIGRDAPALNAVYIQGSISSNDEHQKALPALESIYTDTVAKWDLVPIGFMRFPVFKASIFCRDEPINSLAQLKGKKVRVWSRDLVETFATLGISGQIVPQADLYIAIQTKVIDCALYPNQLAPTVSLQEVTKFGSYLFPVAAMPYVLAVSRAKWNSLSPDVQKAVLDAGKVVYEESRAFETDPNGEKVADEKLTAGGVKILADFPEADRAAFTAAAATSWEKLAKDAGAEAVAGRATVLKAMGR